MASQFQSEQANPAFKGVKDVEPQEVWEKRQEIKIVDVRRPDEFTGELGHIPGAELIVLDTLPEHLADLPKDKSIVFICHSGARSARAAELAQKNGFKSVFNMKGGMVAWNKLSLAVDERFGD